MIFGQFTPTEDHGDSGLGEGLDGVHLRKVEVHICRVVVGNITCLKIPDFSILIMTFVIQHRMNTWNCHFNKHTAAECKAALLDLKGRPVRAKMEKPVNADAGTM